MVSYQGSSTSKTSPVNYMADDVKRTLDSIRLLWDNLEVMVEGGEASPSDNSPVTLELAKGAQLGLDRKNRFHLLLALADGEEPIRTRLTTGIQIQSQAYEISGSEVMMVDIISERRWRFAIEPFSAEIVLRMSNGTIDLRTLREVVEEHRSLWEAPREPLSNPEQRGLIGELSTVMRLGDTVPAASVVTRWRGPERGLHDIADEGFAIEVKTYADEPPKVRITHIEQLDHRMDKRLTLVALHLIKSDEGKSLPEFVDEALEWAEENDCKPHMEEQLKIARWREEDRSEYYSRYILGSIIICPIRPETPVFPAYLKNHIPSSVSNITYSLHLNDLDHISSAEDESWLSLMSEGAWPSVSENALPDSRMTSACIEMHATEAREICKLAAEQEEDPESLHLELKSSIWHPYQRNESPLNDQMNTLEAVIVKTVNGLLNSEGGSLLIGVSDGGETLGLEKDLKTRGLKDLDKYELRLSRVLTDNLGKPPVVECVRVSFPEVNDVKICRVDVKPSMYPVFIKDEKFYARNSNGTIPMNPSEMYTYCIDHWMSR